MNKDRAMGRILSKCYFTRQFKDTSMNYIYLTAIKNWLGISVDKIIHYHIV